mgnify:CR=1 FL=1
MTRSPFSSPEPLIFRGVPTFFRCCCATARSGGDVGYDHPGRELTRHLCDQIPVGMDYNQWISELDSLEQLMSQGEDEAVIDWFVQFYPNCMALVPKRRRGAFLRGVYEMADENGLRNIENEGER